MTFVCQFSSANHLSYRITESRTSQQCRCDL